MFLSQRWPYSVYKYWHGVFPPSFVPQQACRSQLTKRFGHLDLRHSEWVCLEKICCHDTVYFLQICFLVCIVWLKKTLQIQEQQLPLFCHANTMQDVICDAKGTVAHGRQRYQTKNFRLTDGWWGFFSYSWFPLLNGHLLTNRKAEKMRSEMENECRFCDGGMGFSICIRRWLTSRTGRGSFGLWKKSEKFVLGEASSGNKFVWQQCCTVRGVAVLAVLVVLVAHWDSLTSTIWTSSCGFSFSCSWERVSFWCFCLWMEAGWREERMGEAVGDQIDTCGLVKLTFAFLLRSSSVITVSFFFLIIIAMYALNGLTEIQKVELLFLKIYKCCQWRMIFKIAYRFHASTWLSFPFPSRQSPIRKLLKLSFLCE